MSSNSSSSSLDIYMKSSDLIRKERLDYGGFGEVYLCYHITLGRVVLKTVYTGPPRNEQKSSLLEEGSLMSRLNHARVVKLLGVILEDGDYSLVMELLPKGNLQAMLEKVTVPVSIKGRIILEILEGMVYLTNNKIIHKDLKPENILVDDQFHIKIADLGLATCQTWSRLTKDESRRRSRMGRKTSMRAAGTLCYMAPEHLESINTRSTEKSDIYSFSIVVWVILTGREPYENARSEDQICQCVRLGDRPDEGLIPEDAPKDIIRLMKACWEQEPLKRPTFKESYESFSHFYEKELERDIERDLERLMELYEGPSELVEKMKSFSMDQPNIYTGPDGPFMSQRSADSPTPLRSAEPIEASVEDLSFQPSGGLQVDASPTGASVLDHKLAQEFNYHKYGSYGDQPDLTNYSYGQARASLTPFSPGEQPHFQPASSVQSWSKPGPNPLPKEPLQPQQYSPAQPYEFSPYEALPRPEFETQISGTYQQQQHEQHQHLHPSYNRMQSWHGPVHHPTPESLLPESSAGLRVCQPELAKSLYISQTSRVQIGNNNTMNIHSSECCSSFSQTQTSTRKELLRKYEDHAVTEAQLQLIRENVGLKWKSSARKLGLTEVEVDTIEHDYARDGLAEKVHQMLERWKMKEGLQGCTVGKLCHALENHVKADVIHKLLLMSQDGTAM